MARLHARDDRQGSDPNYRLQRVTNLSRECADPAHVVAGNQAARRSKLSQRPRILVLVQAFSV
jgi:hypothetical protein